MENEMLQYDIVSGELKKVSSDEKLLIQVNEKLDEIVKIFKELKDRVSDLDIRIDEFEVSLSDLEYQVKEVESKVDDFEPDEIINQVSSIETDLEELKDNLRNV